MTSSHWRSPGRLRVTDGAPASLSAHPDPPDGSHSRRVRRYGAALLTLGCIVWSAAVPASAAVTSGLAAKAAKAGPTVGGQMVTPSDAAVLPDQRIVVVGSSSAADGSRAVVTLLLPNGRPDRTFGSQGTVVSDLDTGPARAVAVRPDGRFVVATRGGFLLQYTVSGSLDPTFSGDGALAVDEYLLDVAVRPDGDVVSLGDSVSLLSPQGVLRASMEAVQDGGAGFRRIAVQSTGHVVVAGASDCNYALSMRLDPSLATSTWLSDPVGTASVDVLVVQSDKVLITSNGLTDSACGFLSSGIVFERHLASGQRDPTFGDDGAVVVDQTAWPKGARDGQPLSVALHPTGKIVVLGSTYLARFTPSGVPDSTFSGDGVVPLSAGTWSVVVVQADGRVVLLGSSGSGLVVRRFRDTGQTLRAAR